MELPSRLRIVLDTNLVLQDIWYSSRKDTKTALQDALEKAEYWAFMAEQVFDEVEPKLKELCRGDVDKQIRLWRTAYPAAIAFSMRCMPTKPDPPVMSRFFLDGSEREEII